CFYWPSSLLRRLAATSLWVLEVEALLFLQKYASFRSKVSNKQFYNINLNRLLTLYRDISDPLALGAQFGLIFVVSSN
ncbi:MAG TPA: hypothetical protein PKA53_13550, partial [Sphingobacterium sp.]|nr:hypothetical protein [Sphingobacterium sp.]